MYVIKFEHSSHLKENIKKTFDFLTKFIEACLFYMLVVLHFTDNCSSFSYSYIAAEVPFQFVKKSSDCMSHCFDTFYILQWFTYKETEDRIKTYLR